MRLFVLLIAISLVCLGLQFEPMLSLAEWHRQLILDGQWWRILSGNFTHTNFAHLGMNLAALWIISFIFKPTAKLWLFSLMVISVLVGLLNFFSDMTTYVGLSGVLHGLFACFALKEALDGRTSSWLLVVGVVAKVTWELTMGASQSTSELINARIAVESHLFGVISGFLFTLMLRYAPQLNILKNSQR